MKKFAFLIHPRDISDVARKISFIKFLPPRLIELIIEKWGFSICSHFKASKMDREIEGYIIGIGFTARRILELPREKVQRKILEVTLFAQEKLGVEIVGLGALTASITEGGIWLTNQPEVKITISHGNSYGAAVAEEGIEKIINLCKFSPQKTKIAVVGALGIIGREIVKFLAQKGYPLILIEKTKEKINLVEEKLKKLNFEKRIFTTSTNLRDILQADLIITATSHPTALLKSDFLKKGAIIYDIAQPMNVSPELIKERPDIIKIDGAYVSINGINIGFDMGLPKGTTFACLAEIMMMALEEDKNHHVGEIDESYLKRTKEWAKKYGFCHNSFTSFGKPISLERFKIEKNFYE